MLDHTHDKSALSWVHSANVAATDFPIQNLPFSIFRRINSVETFRGGVAIGDQIVDLQAAGAAGCFHGLAAEAAAACGAPALNAFFDMGAPAWEALRHALFSLLHIHAEAQAPTSVVRLRACLVPQGDAEYDLPARIGDYTDFYTSVHHARTVSKIMNLPGGLSPNFQWIPTAYHGRVSSIGVSGQKFHRPRGQRRDAGSEVPVFGPSIRLDYEVELGIFIGKGNKQGHPIALDASDGHVFGICLLNDWSARDIQVWEMLPLGPFQAKNFATTISPWVVTMAALAPFRTAWDRPEGDPQPLPYLEDKANRTQGGIDIQVTASIETASMRSAGRAPARLSQTTFANHYWSVGQMVTHHTAGGCNLRAGDLLGSGTISGPVTRSEAGALLELTLGGTDPVRLGGGEERTYLEDGDAVILQGWCEKNGYARVGFGSSCGTVLPPVAA